MYVQFLRPTADRDGNTPENLAARCALHSADPALKDVAIGGISLWIGDGTKKNRPKGVPSISLPAFGVIAGKPIRSVAIDEDGNESETHVASKSGQKQVNYIEAAILQVWTDCRRAGHDPFKGRFELALPKATEVVEPAVPAQAPAQTEAGETLQ